MRNMIKFWIINKINELLTIRIYQTEFYNKGKKGIEKMEIVIENFWDKLEKFIEQEKLLNRKYIPDELEKMGEEVILEIIRELRKTLNIKEIAQKLFDIEKEENSKLF